MEELVQLEIVFLCPYCGLQCAAGVEPDPFVLHTSPKCEAFDKYEPHEFLCEVRKYLEKDHN